MISNMGAAKHGGSAPGSPEGTMPPGMAWGPPGMVFYLYLYRLLCIRFLITGETHFNATKLGGHPMHLGNADSWHHFRSSRLLPDRLLSDVPQWLVDLFMFHLFYGFDARWWSIESSTNRCRCRYDCGGSSGGVI